MISFLGFFNLLELYMKTKQKGFTLIELLMCIFALLLVILLCSAGYVAIHFIQKFW